MKTIVLSDHVAELRQEARTQREAEHQLKLARHALRIADLQAQTEASWFWRIFRALFGYPRPPAEPRMSDAEHALSAGASGEDLVAQHLCDILPDEWTLLRGYTNRNGEADLVLITDRAVFSIEVKNVNGQISISQATWTRRKVDAFGNVVGAPEAIADRRGRTPLQQAEDVAQSIRWILGRRGLDPDCVRPMVVLTHERATIVDGGAGVPAVLVSDLELVNIRSMQSGLPRFDAGRVVSILTQDHAHWARRGRQPSQRRRSNQ